MHVFLLVYTQYITGIAILSIVFSTKNKQNTNIFIFLHQKQIKSVEITPNKQETPQDWV